MDARNAAALWSRVWARLIGPRPVKPLQPGNPEKRARQRWRTHFCKTAGCRIAMIRQFCPICGGRTLGFRSKTRRKPHQVLPQEV